MKPSLLLKRAVLALALAGLVWSPPRSLRADEKGTDLDRKVIASLLENAEIVVKCHKDTSGNVGMDQRLRARYGLVGLESGFGLPVVETVVGPPVTEKTIGFWYSREMKDEPFFLPAGDYLLFLRHDAQKRWVLVGNFMGLQLFTKGLDDLVKDVQKSVEAARKK